MTVAFYFVSQKITHADIASNGGFIQQIRLNIFSQPFTIFTVLGFTVINWFFEVFKWKTLVSSVQNISFFQAFKQSTSSLTASLLTPNRIGEYGAKAIYYAAYQRKRVMFLNLIGNLSQMLITVAFGLIGFIILYDQFTFAIDFQIKTIYLFVILFILIALIFNQFKKNIIPNIIIYFKQIPISDLIKSIQFSLFRYLIFSHQFYFLLLVFGVKIDYFTAIGAICSMYFIASVIPSFVVFDFIVKGSIAISVFGLFDVPEIIILSITTLMWLLNFALPAIIGSYFVFTFELPTTAKAFVK